MKLDIVLVPLLLSLMKSGSALECHRCVARSGDKSCEEGHTSLPKVTCASIEKQCGTFVFDVITNGSVLTSIYRRDCVAGTTACDTFAKAIGPAFAGITHDSSSKLVQRKCDVCDTDFCNGVVDGGNDLKPQDTGPKLNCYRCIGNQHDESCEVGDSSLSTVECSSLENRCSMSTYDIMKDGEVIAVVYKRGCASSQNFCKIASNNIGKVYESMSNHRGKMFQRNCEVCEGNLCNGGEALAKKRQESYLKYDYSHDMISSSNSRFVIYSILPVIFLSMPMYVILN